MITQRQELDMKIFCSEQIQTDYLRIGRREFCMRLIAAVVAGQAKLAVSHDAQTFQLRYIVGSSMYGRMALILRRRTEVAWCSDLSYCYKVFRQ